MREAYAMTGRNSKSAPIQNGSDLSVSDALPSIHEAITNFFKSIRPLKTWGLIADTLGLKEAAARHRAACQRDYTIEELQVLLHSEKGDEILELLMADAQPRWWQGLQASLTLSRAVAAQAQWQQSVLALDNQKMDVATRRQLTKVRNGDRKFTAARSAQELATGLFLQNQDRAVAGTVAQAQGKAQAGIAGRGGRR